jgi:hypothetical protein
MTKRLCLLVLLAAVVLAPAQAVRAQTSGGGKIRSFITALNQGDVSGALALTTPTFTVKLADGTSATGAAAAPLLASLPTPITIVSLMTANRAGHGMFQFGSAAPAQVDFTGSSGAIASMTVAGPVGSPQPAQGAAPAAGATAISASYPAGWNLIALPPGTSLTGTQGPLYTLQPGDSTYETIQSSAAGMSGFGYWAYFAGTTTLPVAAGGGSYSVRAPAGQFIMVGDPSGSLPARISGADLAYTYDPVSGYQQTTRLTPGKGALVIAVAGGTITVTPSADVATVPPSTTMP